MSAHSGWSLPALLADDGSVMPADSKAVPADAGARIRSGRYAGRDQSDQLRGADVVHAQVGCCSADAVDAGSSRVFLVTH